MKSGAAFGIMLVLILGLAACASAEDSRPMAPAPGAPPAEPAAPREAADGDVAFLAAGRQSLVFGQTAEGETVDRLIVRTATLRMEVGDVQESVGSVEAIAGELGGYVHSSNVSGLPERPQAVVRLRVPVDRFVEARQRLRELADIVLSEETSSDDVTEEYVDLSARLRNQQDVEQQLAALLERADSVDDVLSVQRELNRVREEIERLQGRIQYLEQSAAESTIAVHMTQSGAGVRVTAAWAPENTFRNAAGALMNVLRSAGNTLIVAGVFAPLWVPVGLAGFWVYRRQSRQGPPA